LANEPSINICVSTQPNTLDTKCGQFTTRDKLIGEGVTTLEVFPAFEILRLVYGVGQIGAMAT
jgi:hypothetical protein